MFTMKQRKLKKQQYRCKEIQANENKKQKLIRTIQKEEEGSRGKCVSENPSALCMVTDNCNCFGVSLSLCNIAAEDTENNAQSSARRPGAAYHIKECCWYTGQFFQLFQGNQRDGFNQNCIVCTAHRRNKINQRSFGKQKQAATVRFLYGKLCRYSSKYQLKLHKIDDIQQQTIKKEINSQNEIQIQILNFPFSHPCDFGSQ